MKKIQGLPNVKYLHQIEDEYYQYAVDHPDEYMAKNLAVYDYLDYSPKFMRRLYWLYRFGEYNDTLNKARDYAREHPYESWTEYARRFIEKHPQWKDLYYYDEDELDLEEKYG